ncbi:MAG: hypothetical protein II847_02880 [Ruminobacter sp.]|uniref:Uncharacterized protein n=1 Tax=Ruminobacter amylophilus TaxID=867 RepID=A0A662ZII9_9GAMM|nr:MULTISPECIES: DUF6506 family protein [Ruminobacter]MBQ3775057.1 hypothetical protein [Ruminobacter sp.]SFP50827.1 hypothetical protein SAMN02910344_01578 [Ruminobacter amylophilus]
MKVEAAFIFVAPKTDRTVHKCDIDTEILNLHVVGVGSYAEGVEVARELVENGVKVIELCAGFGNEGVAMITRAVHGKAKVGAVKFDCHPGLDFKSGDELFA